MNEMRWMERIEVGWLETALDYFSTGSSMIPACFEY